MRTIVSTFLVLSLSVAAQSAHAGFIDHGDGTVTDTSSTLMWQQCSAPSSGASCGTGSPATYIWDDALAYCNA